MLTVTIKNFRCYTDFTIKIPLGCTTLIKGTSGCGKTTILKAITWALYGVNKKKQIHPFTASSSANTNVTIDLYDINIMRSTNPKKLRLKHNNLEYYDLDAQNQINNFFGEKDIWLSTSYVVQKSENHFVLASNAKKIDMLNMIAFQDESPTEYIDKIDKCIEENKIEQQIKIGIIDEMTRKFNESDIDLIKFKLNEKDLLKIENDLILKRQLYDELLSLQNNRIINMAIKSNKEQELNDLIKEYDLNKELYNTNILDVKFYNNIEVNKILELKTVTVHDLNILNHEIVYLEHIQAKIEQCNKLYKHIQNNNFDVDMMHNYTLNDLQEISKNESIYYSNDKILKRNSLNHDINDINNYILYCQDILESQKSLLVKNKINKLNNNLNDINLKLSHIENEIKIQEKLINNIDLSIYDTTELHNNVTKLTLEQGCLLQQLQQLNESKMSTKCPYCENDVLYKNGTLIKVCHFDSTEMSLLNKQIESNKNNIINMKNKIKLLKIEEQQTIKTLNEHKRNYDKSINFLNDNINLKNNIQSNIDKMKIELDTFPGVKYNKLLTENELLNINKCIDELRNIIIIDKPIVTSDMIKQYLNQQEHITKYNNIIEEIPKEFRNCEDKLKEYILNLKNYVNKSSMYITKLNFLDVNINTLKKQISEIIIINDQQEDIITVKNDIDILQDLIDKHLKSIIISKDYDKLLIDKENLDMISDKINNLYKLKKIASDVECVILENIVNCINYNIHEICSCLFDQDIKIELSLLKKMKSSDKIKHDVNFVINYKNGHYDDILETSGGESDRISLAITMAFNKLSNYKIIMFDETTGSLDIELKNLVIKTIKENMNGTAIVIQPDGVEGIFDHVITL
jgi:DNA repair exonuclease SbcCD ATPase subunit